jgi:hypothetical protein
VLSLPLWFIEGMAEYLSLGPVDANTAMWVRDASSREKMPTIKKLSDPDFFPYRYGHAFWAYVAGRWGDSAVGDMLRATGPSGDIDAALMDVLGTDEETLTKDWHAETQKTYAALFESTQKARDVCADSREREDERRQAEPHAGPQPRRQAHGLLSERSRLSIDMFLADVETGKVIRQLTKTAADPHFDSLEFLSSAGDWAPDNKRFVFSALVEGPAGADDHGRRQRQAAARAGVPDIGEIYNPAWSPNGQQIAFSGLKGGLLDLFIFDIGTKALTQITNDPFADSDPEWSPDGSQLAWVTDRFSSDMSVLRFGNYRIGLMDVATRQIRQLAGFTTGRNTNPEFTADGRAMFFIATPDGIANVYRTELASGRTTRITNVLSGVSGITPLTPALSVAAAAPTVVFSVFEADNYTLYATTDKDSGTAAATALNPQDAAVLPPLTRRQNEVDVLTMLQTPAAGLPAEQSYPDKDYSAKLGLDMVAQPTVGVGVDRWGAYAGGGISFIWSDVLGNHQLGTTLQLSNRFEDIGGAVMYLNRTHRWNWGVIGEQTPYTPLFMEPGDHGQPELRHCPSVRAAGASATADQSGHHGDHAVSAQPRATRRVQRRHSTDQFQPGTALRLLCPQRRLRRQHQGKAGEPGRNQPRRGECGAGLGYVGLRRNQPDRGPAVSLRDVAVDRYAAVFGCAGDYRKYFMARPFTLAMRGCTMAATAATARTGACRRSSSATRTSSAATTAARSRPMNVRRRRPRRAGSSSS